MRRSRRSRGSATWTTSASPARGRSSSPPVTAGDALIRHDLEARGIESELVVAVLDGLEPERERARADRDQREGEAPRQPGIWHPAASVRTHSKQSLQRRTEKR